MFKLLQDFKEASPATRWLIISFVLTMVITIYALVYPFLRVELAPTLFP